MVSNKYSYFATACQRWSLSGLSVGYPAEKWVCNRIRKSKHCFQTGTGYG